MFIYTLIIALLSGMCIGFILAFFVVCAELVEGFMNPVSPWRKQK